MGTFDLSILAAFGLGLLALALTYLLVQRFGSRRTSREYEQAVAEGRHIPASLHPVIDGGKCIGSGSCIKACPEGDIIGLRNGVAVLIEGSKCIGHGTCLQECPVDAIKLVFGTSERGIDIPELGEAFESSRPGVHVIGELGGMGLIRNAMVQGLQIAELLKRRIAAQPVGRREMSQVSQLVRDATSTSRTEIESNPLGALGTGLTRVADLAQTSVTVLTRMFGLDDLLGRPKKDDRLDVVIVGAGPAGIGAAIGCQQAGLSFRVLEQDSVGGAVAHYPRQKLVMTEKVVIPGFGLLGRPLLSKEELLETFQGLLSRLSIRIEEKVRVMEIDGRDGAFDVFSTKGTYRCRKVVLAIGRRGTPRKLGVPGEELSKVTYALVEPEQYRGKRVLVVGGGDSALEAAIQLAQETDAKVDISYRGKTFSRCREANRKKIFELIESGRVRGLLESKVLSVNEREVRVIFGDKEVPVLNDFVIVCAGADPPVEFLERCGDALQRHFGEHTAHVPIPSLSAAGVASDEPDHFRRNLNLALYGAGALLLLALGWLGSDYYALPQEQRFESPMHESWRPAGSIGHGIGIVATAVMFGNFLYSARKRLRAFKKLGNIRTWLDVHVFIGLLAPAVIAFHAAFQWNNLLAVTTFVCMVVVTVTGLLGRFIYGLVPSAVERNREIAAQLPRWQRLLERVRPESLEPASAERLQQAMRWISEKGTEEEGLSELVLRTPREYLQARAGIAAVRRSFPDPVQYREFRDALVQALALRLQLAVNGGLRALLAAWRVFHVVLSIFLVVVVAAHVAVTVYLGFRWIF